MIVQLDTNVLTRLAQPAHPLNSVTLSAVRKLESAGHVCCIVPQNLYEFWVVATRPIATNGLGLAILEARRELDQIRKAFVLHRDPPSLVDEWENLVVAHQCQGKPAHDARIIAAMQVRAVSHLLTFNGRDFTRYSSITILDPAALASATGIALI